MDVETKHEAEQGGDGGQWARVEILGHRRHYGRIREVEQFGAKMLRVDIPNLDRPGEVEWVTICYGANSIFSIAFTDEATVMHENRPRGRPYPMLPAAEDADGAPTFEEA